VQTYVIMFFMWDNSPFVYDKSILCYFQIFDHTVWRKKKFARKRKFPPNSMVKILHSCYRQLTTSFAKVGNSKSY